MVYWVGIVMFLTSWLVLTIKNDLLLLRIMVNQGWDELTQLLSEA